MRAAHRYPHSLLIVYPVQFERYGWDETNKDVGTTMFKKQGGGGGGGGGKGNKYTAVKIAEFLPNVVLAFAPCTSSWHGVAVGFYFWRGAGLRSVIPIFVLSLSFRRRI